MCGRFVSTTPPDQLAADFGADLVRESSSEEPNYNVAPTTNIHVVVETAEERAVDAFRWGLVHSWAKDIKIGNRMINARSETLADKNAFKRAFARTRCIVPADSFYEWVQVDGLAKKTPIRIVRTDGAPFAFAGLWARWHDPETEDVVRSCTIITGEPNERIARIHDRMPVMLPPSAWDEWLDADQHDTAALARFFVPAPAELMTFHPVGTAVNNVRSRGAELIEAVEVPGAPVAEGGTAA